MKVITLYICQFNYLGGNNNNKYPWFDKHHTVKYPRTTPNAVVIIRAEFIVDAIVFERTQTVCVLESKAFSLLNVPYCIDSWEK